MNHSDAQTADKQEGDYYIRIDYGENANPIIVFASAVKLFESLENLSGALLGTIGDISATAVIVDVERGSLITWLRDRIIAVDEPTIERYVDKPREMLKDMLIITRRKIIKMIPENQTQPQLEQRILDTVEAEIIESGLDAYGYKVKKDKLLVAVSDISQSVKEFPNGVSFGEKGKEEMPISSLYYHDPLQAEGVTVQDRLIKDSFIIKKPDLVGQSRWTLLYDKSIEAEIKDTVWIKALKNREFGVMSGDKMNADMRIITWIDSDFNVIDSKYMIEKVHGLEAPKPKQPLIEI